MEHPLPGYRGHIPFEWSRTHADFKGPHAAPESKLFNNHILGYTGHVSKLWISKVDTPMLDKAARSKSAPQSQYETTTKFDSSLQRSCYGMPGYMGHQPSFWRPPSNRTRPTSMGATR